MVTVTQLREALEALEGNGCGNDEVRFVSGMSFHPKHTALSEVAAPVNGKVLLLENLGWQEEYLEQDEIDEVNDSFENVGFDNL